MGKAFVAKLAKEGARDPEALAAWIGRNKHGAKAFKKLSKAGQKKGDAKSSDKPKPSAPAATSKPSAVAEQPSKPEAPESSAGKVSAAQHRSGTKVYGSPDLIERATQRTDYDSGTTTASGGDHDALMRRASPAFRRKVQEARNSGRPWMHQVGRDSSGAEIHDLQFKDADGKTQKVTYLERNSAAWKRMSVEERRRRHDARNS